MATIHPAMAQAPGAARGQSDAHHRGLRKAGKVIAAGLRFCGEALAVFIVVAEAIFYCAYLAILPFVLVMALTEIPQRLRKHFQK